MSKYPKLYDRVLHYIEENLDEALDVKLHCEMFCLSRFHFHRQCSAYFGMPVISLVRLLRLKRAAYQLAYHNEEKVVDIAMASGYDSHEAFSRSFKRYFNKSPSEFRNSPNWSLWHSKYEPISKLRTKIMHDNVEFNVKIVDFPETQLAVLEHRGSPTLLGKTVNKFINWRKENSLPPNKSKTFNLVYDDPTVVAPDDYKMDVCCSVSCSIEKNEQGVINKTIPQGKCAFIRHVGSDDTIGVTVNYIYNQWLLKSEYHLRDFPLFFERVSFFPEVPENEMITDIYLPVEK